LDPTILIRIIDSCYPDKNNNIFEIKYFPFSRFALPDGFSALPSASGPDFTFCAPGRVFRVSGCVESVFKFCAPGRVFRVTEGVGSHFQVLRSWTRFPCYRVRRVPFSRFALPDAFFKYFSCNPLAYKLLGHCKKTDHGMDKQRLSILILSGLTRGFSLPGSFVGGGDCLPIFFPFPPNSSQLPYDSCSILRSVTMHVQLY